VSAAALTPGEPPVGRARYVAIIADGNRRWARARNLAGSDGHEAGTDTLRARIADAIELGIRELMVYSFSTENWSRPTGEVRALIDMISRRISEDGPRLHMQGVRMRFVGSRERIPNHLLERMRHAESLTARNDALTLFIALDYGARAEVLDAAARYRGGGEAAFRELLYAPEMHDPDLIVRTGGECRLSNYLLWQAAYAELVFRDEMWPDFTRTALEECLAEYAARQRRWGGRYLPQDATSRLSITLQESTIKPNDST
jgi:undecaprenyl diphosphate synthase